MLRNTLSLSICQLLIGFPFPVIFALALNNLKDRRYKRTIQMVTYAPHFISVVVMSGTIIQFLDLRSGIFNQILVQFGGKQINFMGIPHLFSTVYVSSHVWQNTGWGTIIYLAALSGIDPQLHEAAIMDGASRMQRIRNIDLPGSILPTIIVLLILNTGRIMQVGFTKVLFLQNPLDLRMSEVIQTHVYKVGLASSIADLSYATAIGLFTARTNLTLVVTVNAIAGKTSETSLW